MGRHYGLDIGGTKIELAIFDHALQAVDSWRAATPKEDYQAFLTILTDMVFKADQRAAQKDAAAGTVGIGIPGTLDKQGRTTLVNIPCANGRPLGEDLAARLGRPVAIENDSNTFILSEFSGGAADGLAHALGLIVGTGVSCGLCVHGRPYRGSQGIAGESGHLPLPAVLQQRYALPLRPCACGLSACMEQYLAGPGLLWLCSHLGAEYTSVAGLIDGVNAQQPQAQEVFSAYIDCLACYLAQLTLIYDPDVIVLGGGLSNIAELYSALSAAIPSWLFAGIAAPKVVAAEFGDSSGVRGAAILGRQAAEQAT